MYHCHTHKLLPKLKLQQHKAPAARPLPRPSPAPPATSGGGGVSSRIFSLTRLCLEGFLLNVFKGLVLCCARADFPNAACLIPPALAADSPEP